MCPLYWAHFFYTFMCICMSVGGHFPVRLCVSICQCIQLPLLMEIFPGEKALRSEFNLRFHFDDAVCLVKPIRVRRLKRNCSTRIKEPQWKIDKGGCLKDEQEQKGSLLLGAHR